VLTAIAHEVLLWAMRKRASACCSRRQRQAVLVVWVEFVPAAASEYMQWHAPPTEAELRLADG